MRRSNRLAQEPKLLDTTFNIDHAASIPPAQGEVIASVPASTYCFPVNILDFSPDIPYNRALPETQQGCSHSMRVVSMAGAIVLFTTVHIETLAENIQQFAYLTAI